MISTILNRLHRMIGMRLYTDATVILLAQTEKPTIQADITIKPVTLDNVGDASAFERTGKIVMFRKFLIAGDHGYYAYQKGTCVHRSWVVDKPGKVLIHKFHKIVLHSGEVFIHFCETAPAARGHNVFPAVLCYIGQQFNNSRVLISVDSKNIASLRSVAKAGFTEVDSIRVRMIMGIKFIR